MKNILLKFCFIVVLILMVGVVGVVSNGLIVIIILFYDNLFFKVEVEGVKVKVVELGYIVLVVFYDDDVNKQN